jgi:tRNA pseudouridine55 synthase
MTGFTGDIDQVPSAVSAIKIDGKRSYRRVREGEQVALAARRVHVARYDLLGVRQVGDLLDLDVAVECSSGTYVRALARDLGTALGTGGHLTALRRNRVGPFTLDQASTLDELAVADDPVTLPLAAAVRAAMPVRTVDDAEASALSYGKPLTASGIDGVHGALTADGTAVALLRDEGAEARPVIVFAAAG